MTRKEGNKKAEWTKPFVSNGKAYSKYTPPIWFHGVSFNLTNLAICILCMIKAYISFNNKYYKKINLIMNLL